MLKVRRALLLLLPTVLMVPLIDSELAPRILGISVSGEKLTVMLLVGCNATLAFGSRNLALPLIGRGILVATFLCFMAVALGAIHVVQDGLTQFLARDVAMYVFKLCLPIVIAGSIVAFEDLQALCRGLMALTVIAVCYLTMHLWLADFNPIAMGNVLMEGESIWGMEDLERVRLSVFANLNLTGFLLTTGGLGCLGFREICFEKTAGRRFGTVLGVLALAMAALTLSRSGLVSLFLIGTVWVVRDAGSRLPIALTSLVGLALVGTLIWWLPTSSTVAPGRLTGSVSRLGSGDAFGSFGVARRLAISRATIEALQDTPVLGIGLGQARWKIMANVERRRNVTLGMHSGIFSVWADLGFFGLIAFAALVWAQLSLVGRLVKSGDRLLIQLGTVARLWLVVVLANAVVHDMHTINLVWLLMGFAPAGWRVVQARRLVTGVRMPEVVADAAVVPGAGWDGLEHR